MAILGKIRKQTGLTIVVVGVALLAFIAIDAIGQNRCAPDPNNIGSVNGMKISDSEYSMAKNAVSGNYGGRAPQNIIDNQAWENLIRQKLFEEKAEEIDLRVSDQKFWEAIAPQLGLQNGIEAQEFVAQRKLEAEQGDAAMQRFMMQFNQSEASFRKYLLQQEYLKLVTAGNRATKVETAFQAKATTDQANFDYAYASYEDLKKKFPIEVSDEEIEEYVAKYPKKFQRKAERELHFVRFPGEPSEKDEQKVLAEINRLAGGTTIDSLAVDSLGVGDNFRNTTNDSLFIITHSDTDFETGYFTPQEIERLPLAQESVDFLKKLEIGKMGGPFKDENRSNYQLVKVLGSKSITDSVRTKHLLITYQGAKRANTTRTREEAKALGDSLLQELKKDYTKYDQFAIEFSDDQAAVQKGGDIGWIGRNSRNIDPAYLEAALELKVGDIHLVESEFGVHIMRAEELKKKTAYRIGLVTKNLEASKQTMDNNHANASRFAQEMAGKTLQEFADAAREKGYEYDFADNVDRYGTGLSTPALNTDKLPDILRWAFNKDTEVGDLEYFTAANQDKFVVYLAEKLEEGLATADQARSEVLPLLEQKKIYEKVKSEKITTLDGFVSKTGGQKSQATVAFNANAIPERGNEPAVVGAAFGLKPGATSSPIQGNNGVYLVKMNRITGSSNNTKEEQLGKQIQSQMGAAINSQLYQSLKDNAELKDNRDKVYR